MAPHVSRPPEGAERGRVVLGCPDGERHVLGLRMLADLFAAQGWRVLYLGADVPTRDWVRLVQRYDAEAVAISANSRRRAPAVQNLIAALRAARPELLILAGGAAFDRAPDLWQQLGADLYRPDPMAAVAAATDWLENNRAASAPVPSD